MGSIPVSSFLAGAAAVAAFAPVGFLPILVFSFAWLVHLLVAAPPRRAFWVAFWFGLGLFGAGVSWVYVSLSQFGGMWPPLAALATFLFCALLACFTGAAGWLQARIAAPPALRACLLVPAAWALGEWLRSWVLSGFPWLSAGYAATGWPLQGFAPVLGVFGISFVIVSLSGLVWVVAKSRKRARFVALGGILALLLLGEGLQRATWTEPVGEPLHVALLQGNVEQEM